MKAPVPTIAKIPFGKSKFVITFILFFSFFSLKGQQFYDPNLGDTNIYQMYQNYMATYVPDSTDQIENSKISYFLKFYNFWAPRLSPTGSFKSASYAFNQYATEFTSHRHSPMTIIPATWQEKGPKQNGLGNFSCIPDVGIGAINILAFDPNNSNNMYAGARDGGVFQSTDGGNSWHNFNTDVNFATLGVSSIVVDPDNVNHPNTVYAATGDIEAEIDFSDAVYCTDNNGASWTAIGPAPLRFNPPGGLYYIGQIAADPTSGSNNLIAATDLGIFRSTNRGTSATWTLVTTTEKFTSVVYDPVNPNIVYAGGYEILKSTDGGATWTSISTASTGLNLDGAPLIPQNFYSGPNQEYMLRVKLYITGDDSYIYAEISTSPTATWYPGANNYKHVCRYDISSNTWTIESDPYGNGYTGNYGRSAFATVPYRTSSSRDSIFAAQVSPVIGSGNDGLNWSLSSLPYMHSDQHDLRFSPFDPNTLWECTDGGIVSYNIKTRALVEHDNGLGVGTSYHVSTSEQSRTEITCGNQDVGDYYYDISTGWILYPNLNNSCSYWVGDGAGTLIDYSDSNSIVMGSLYSEGGCCSKGIALTTGGPSGVFSMITPEDIGSGLPPLVQDPFDHKTLIEGRCEIIKATDATIANSGCGTYPSYSGCGWTPLSNFQTTTPYQIPTVPGVLCATTALAISEKNNNIMYVGITTSDPTRVEYNLKKRVSPYLIQQHLWLD